MVVFELFVYAVFMCCWWVELCMSSEFGYSNEIKLIRHESHRQVMKQGVLSCPQKPLTFKGDLNKGNGDTGK